MRSITFKAGRRVWLMLVDGCEVGTNVPVSQSIDQAVRVVSRMFPGAGWSYPIVRSVQT